MREIIEISASFYFQFGNACGFIGLLAISLLFPAHGNGGPSSGLYVVGDWLRLFDTPACLMQRPVWNKPVVPVAFADL